MWLWAGSLEDRRKMPDNRLLTAVEIEEVWKQLSMKPLSNALFRFAAEIAIKQSEVTIRSIWEKAMRKVGLFPHAACGED